MKKVIFSLAMTSFLSINALANTNPNVTNNEPEDQYQTDWKFFGVEIKTSSCQPVNGVDGHGYQVVTEKWYAFGIKIYESSEPKSCNVEKKIEDIN